MDDDELKCEVCDKPATHVLSGTWTGSTAGPLTYCIEHLVPMVTDLAEHGDDDYGDGVLLSFTVGRLG